MSNQNICTFCKGAFTCGCQKTTDEEGKLVHKGCLNAANVAIRKKNE